MSYRQELSIFGREKALIKLISDAEEIGYAPELISSYKLQLSEVQAEVKEINARKGRAKLSQANTTQTSTQNNSNSMTESNRANDEDTADLPVPSSIPFLLSSVIYISGIGYTTREQEHARQKALNKLFRKLDRGIFA